jgi:hypothetical protein
VIVQKLRDEDDRIAAVATIRDPGEGNGDEVPVDGAPIPQVEPPAEPADDDAGV